MTAPAPGSAGQPLDLNPPPRKLAYDIYLIERRLARIEAWLAKHNAGENSDG